MIIGNIHLKQLNPYIVHYEKLIIPKINTLISIESEVAFGSVSSFGFGGTNSHVIVGVEKSDFDIISYIQRSKFNNYKRKSFEWKNFPIYDSNKPIIVYTKNSSGIFEKCDSILLNNFNPNIENIFREFFNLANKLQNNNEFGVRITRFRHYAQEKNDLYLLTYENCKDKYHVSLWSIEYKLIREKEIFLDMFSRGISIISECIIDKDYRFEYYLFGTKY
ncbi:polyketide synthase [Cryptosporidium hominis TU502]|uniref:polyketide synthase n=1 Tax=Cryptosporidium hominis (strain TU502) TaxID=353151 RepID=UPI0000453108|nr:polyketide synthase [Cryptosporidium hominis TU502]